MTAVRIFFVGGYLSYRALFNWISPRVYVPTMLGGTLFVMLLFAYAGRYAGVNDDEFFVIGNAVYVSSISCVYGSIMGVANERFFGTLLPVLATPARRIPLFLGRSVPYIANGLLVSAWGLLAGSLLLDVDASATTFVRLAPAVLVSVVSCTAFGLSLGSIGLRVRDVFFIGNLAYYVLLVFTGANVPRETLPPLLQAVSSFLPLTHGIAAARATAGGAPIAETADLLGTELLIGAGYAVVAFGLFRWCEEQARRHAALEAL